MQLLISPAVAPLTSRFEELAPELLLHILSFLVGEDAWRSLSRFEHHEGTVSVSALTRVNKTISAIAYQALYAYVVLWSCSGLRAFLESLRSESRLVTLVHSLAVQPRALVKPAYAQLKGYVPPAIDLAALLCLFKSPPSGHQQTLCRLHIPPHSLSSPAGVLRAMPWTGLEELETIELSASTWPAVGGFLAAAQESGSLRRVGIRLIHGHFETVRIPSSVRTVSLWDEHWETRGTPQFTPFRLDGRVIRSLRLMNVSCRLVEPQERLFEGWILAGQTLPAVSSHYVLPDDGMILADFLRRVSGSLRHLRLEFDAPVKIPHLTPPGRSVSNVTILNIGPPSPQPFDLPSTILDSITSLTSLTSLHLIDCDCRAFLKTGHPFLKHFIFGREESDRPQTDHFLESLSQLCVGRSSGWEQLFPNLVTIQLASANFTTGPDLGSSTYSAVAKWLDFVSILLRDGAGRPWDEDAHVAYLLEHEARVGDRPWPPPPQSPGSSSPAAAAEPLPPRPHLYPIDPLEGIGTSHGAVSYRIVPRVRGQEQTPAQHLLPQSTPPPPDILVNNLPPGTMPFVVADAWRATGGLELPFMERVNRARHILAEMGIPTITDGSQPPAPPEFHSAPTSSMVFSPAATLEEEGDPVDLDGMDVDEEPQPPPTAHAVQETDPLARLIELLPNEDAFQIEELWRVLGEENDSDEETKIAAVVAAFLD